MYKNVQQIYRHTRWDGCRQIASKLHMNTINHHLTTHSFTHSFTHSLTHSLIGYMRLHTTCSGCTTSTHTISKRTVMYTYCIYRSIVMQCAHSELRYVVNRNADRRVIWICVCYVILLFHFVTYLFWRVHIPESELRNSMMEIDHFGGIFFAFSSVCGGESQARLQSSTFFSPNQQTTRGRRLVWDARARTSPLPRTRVVRWLGKKNGTALQSRSQADNTVVAGVG